MRYAIFSDVHAYPPALEKVLDDAASEKVDERICLGDVVGYGPYPVGAVKMCRERCDVVVAGNHDAAVAGQISTLFFIPRAKEGVGRHRSQLSAEDIAWLAALPMSVMRENFAGAHGEFHRRRSVLESGFDYVMSATDAAMVMNALPPGIDLAFVGHTHAACVWKDGGDKSPWPSLQPPEDFAVEEGRRYVVNIGAVGYPRYHAETIYVIYDSSARSVSFRRIPFDCREYLAAMEACGIDPPIWLTDRIAMEAVR